MCTLVAAVRSRSSEPLLVAANRDEMLARPAAPPRLWPGPTRFVAPRDELAGGTWLGLNEHGLFVGITNRRGTPPDPAKRSRGLLVTDALGARSAGALHERLAGLEPGRYAPFHLLYADRATAHVTWSDGERIHHLDLAPGVHVITERSFGAGPPEREAQVRAAWGALGPAPGVEEIAALLTHHAPDPFAGTCVHADALGYGTRSAMALALGEGWPTCRLRWADGRPCRTAFTDQATLVGRLTGGP